MKEQAKNYIFWWLISGAFLIFLMVVIGGITRLTGSGLSITEWNVVMGAVPPLNDTEWNLAFEKYKQIPQYQKLNYHYSLDDFKKIFFWEYLHRLIGRLIGLVFIVPFLFFIYKKWLNSEWIKKSLILFLLGGLQGFLGWFMVKSGLSERTTVSHYRLAIHLSAAFITYAFTFWFALQLKVKPLPGKPPSSVITLLILVSTQIIYGAFVAGLHAGRIANTFPTMDGEWIPSGILAMHPAYLNFFENHLAVQFIHRAIAYGIVIFSAIVWINQLKNKWNTSLNWPVHTMMAIVVIQFLLGVFTLLYHVPVSLAVVHQAVALLLFTSLIMVLYGTRLKSELVTDGRNPGNG